MAAASVNKTGGDHLMHIEVGQGSDSRNPGHEIGIMLDDRVVTLDSDELRDQVAAQVKKEHLSFTSAASLQLFFFDSWGTGFDSSLMGAMNSNDRWHSDLGIPKTGGYLGIVTAIYTIGNLVGSFVAGPVSDRYGRRIGMFVGSVVVLVGAIVMSTAQTSGAYMAGRFLSGFGVALVRSAAPAFVTEIAPPQWRGPATLLYNSLWLIGAILASGVAYSTGPLNSSMSWKIPLILQVIPSAIVVIFSLFLPESPRWLVANDRYEEARELLVKYHAGGNENSPLVALEMAEMRASIRQQASDKRWYDYSELVNSKSSRYRTFLVFSMGCIGQWGGSNLTGYYQANILRSIGVEAQASLLAYNLGYYVAALGGATIGSLTCDMVGRRKLLMFGCLAMCCCLVALTGLTSQYHSTQSSSVSNLTIAFIFFVGIFHSGGINPLVVAYPAECLHTNTRAKGMGLNNFTLNVAEFVNTYGAPIALARMGWRIYIIYAVWNVVQTAWIYFFFVETKGRTLEELDAIFESKNPVKESLKKVKLVEPVTSAQVKGVEV
ncbi:hypothetical protein N7510_003135 [Penicillium lagena]|uniref:uncharacterized protein n=1 Tax=Penicillium lagena TaxID=94218 RepID=UPI0025409010|nr:uncharacterized protein N7510_003135 [Penicillium lagena]KAJ5619151.1 hypothetical protein N7510_003135 [Penicillium lagena]